jgi:hypothetical protein
MAVSGVAERPGDLVPNSLAQTGSTDLHGGAILRAAELVIQAGKSPTANPAIERATSEDFFVEAKKPSFNVKEDVISAYQLRRYAWSAKLPLSILTDVEDVRRLQLPDQARTRQGVCRPHLLHAL